MFFSIKPFAQTGYSSSGTGKPATTVSTDLQPPPMLPPWEGRAIATHKLRLVEFSGFLEHHVEPDTVSIKITRLSKYGIYRMNFTFENIDVLTER